MSPIAIRYLAATFAAGLAVGIGLVLLPRRRTLRVSGTGFMLAGLCLGVYGVRGLLVTCKPYRLQVKPATFSTILSGSPGKALVIENCDSRTAVVRAVKLNGEHDLTQRLESVPCGQHVEYPVKLAPGESLKLVVCDAFVRSSLLPKFEDIFPVESRLLRQHEGPEDHTEQANAKGGYEKEIRLVEIETDLGTGRFEPDGGCIGNGLDSTRQETVQQAGTSPKAPSGSATPEGMPTGKEELLKLIRESEDITEKEREEWIKLLPRMAADQRKELARILREQKRIADSIVERHAVASDKTAPAREESHAVPQGGMTSPNLGPTDPSSASGPPSKVPGPSNVFPSGAR